MFNFSNGSFFFVVAISITFYELWYGEWEFISRWDDLDNFQRNDMITGLDFDTIRKMWTQTRINVYEPVAWMVKAAIYSYYGLDSRIYRLVSLLLHSQACIVLMRTISMILLHLESKRDPNAIRLASLAVCTLFAIHPINVEVIGWPSAQSYTLAMFFSSLSIHCHVRRILVSPTPVRPLATPELINCCRTILWQIQSSLYCSMAWRC